MKNAVCAVCEVLYVQDSRDGISSETNDGYSIVYKSNAQAQRQKLYEAAALHLAPELLYRGAAL